MNVAACHRTRLATIAIHLRAFVFVDGERPRMSALHAEQRSRRHEDPEGHEEDPQVPCHRESFFLRVLRGARFTLRAFVLRGQ